MYSTPFVWVFVVLSRVRQAMTLLLLLGWIGQIGVLDLRMSTTRLMV